MSQKESTNETLKDLVQIMPHEVKEDILDTVLIHRNIMTLHGMLTLYISKNGLDQGPLIDLPYHPVYPFLTIPYMNPVHYHKFPEEAYLLMWYLADTYTVGVTIHKDELLRYLFKCTTRNKHPTYKKLHKWLTLFKDEEWWREKLISEKSPEVFITFKTTTTYDHEDEGMIVRKHYDAEIHTDFQDDFHEKTAFMAWLNGLDESEIDPRMLCPWTTHWHNEEVYPIGFREDMKQLLVKYHFNTERNFRNPWERRLLPGRSVYTRRVFLNSWISDSGSDGDDDYG